MTLASVREELRKLGITIRKKDGEYRVNFKGGSESTAYYTNDIEDARNTGINMANDSQCYRYILMYRTKDEDTEQAWECHAPNTTHAINQLLNSYLQSCEKVTVIEHVYRDGVEIDI